LAQYKPPDPNKPRPIEALDTVFIEEMTWMEVRDALKAGKTTVIVATGGIEQNGPYLALGKHNYVLQAMTEAIARKLGNALVSPIIKLVPEGAIDPPSGHMRYPGTISLREETFKSVLMDVCSSLRTHGFKNIILIGDSGGNQKGMKEVAEMLNTKWASGKTRMHYILEYYDYPGLTKWLEDQGIKQVSEGIHDDYGISSIMMTVEPTTVRMEQRLAKKLFSINGVDMSPAENTIGMGKKAVEWRASITVKAIRRAVTRK
jgi:creatinine amidohydrolase/Fe(II)-dependent formamide hydrolase-like protein